MKKLLLGTILILGICLAFINVSSVHTTTYLGWQNASASFAFTNGPLLVEEGDQVSATFIPGSSFGYATVGKTMWEVQNTDYKGCKFTLAEPATINVISLCCKERWSNPSFSLEMAIYNVNDAGLPNTLMGQTSKVDYTDG